MSAICTYCGDPITPTEKTWRGPNGTVHYRCAKRGPRTPDAVLTECQTCHATTYSPLLRVCLRCKAVLDV